MNEACLADHVNRGLNPNLNSSKTKQVQQYKALWLEQTANNIIARFKIMTRISENLRKVSNEFVLWGSVILFMYLFTDKDV